MFDVRRTYSRNSTERDPSLHTYVGSTLRKLNVPDLQYLHRIFLEDAGVPLTASPLIVLEKVAPSSVGTPKHWVFVEESEQGRVRAWRFESLVGVSAQFCSKLLLQKCGAIGVGRFCGYSGVPEISRFKGVGPYGRCSLLMAPAEDFSK